MTCVGIDEVGRGCWAGPLVAGAVVLKDGFVLEDCPVKLRDSKKMTKRQRELAAEYLLKNAFVGLGWVTVAEIDTHGMTWAVGAAMARALAEVTANYNEIIIDGSINYLKKNHMVNPMVSHMVKTMVRADDLVPAVSAASIVAKVARDKYMQGLSEKYAIYGFEKHVGYGTAAHLAALELYGVCDLHRLSFKPIQKLLGAA